MNARTGRSLSVRQLWPLFVFAAVVLWCAFGECAEPGWFEHKPRGAVDGRGILREMLSRCPAYGLRQIRRFDPATQCHEATHFCNGEISRTVGQDYGAFYVGRGRCFVLTPPPNVTIGMVARYVPQRLRTNRYRLYCCGDRVQRNCLSLLDELSCYTNDAQCTKELRLRDDGGLKFANEFCGYADCVVEAVRRHDPQYTRLNELIAFVDYQKQRVAKLTGSAGSLRAGGKP